jgi:CLIP-associating protein 1/2
LRSIIVKESCTVLVLLAENLKSAFEPYVAYYLPALLKQIIIKIKIIADSADQCIRCLITETQVKNLKSFVEGARSQKDIIIRKRCTEYLSLMLNLYDNSSLEKLRDNFEVVILSNLSDAAGEVRTEARKCYWLFAAKWREDGMRIFNQVDPLVQKYLNKESASSPEVKRAVKSVPHSPLKLASPTSSGCS